MHANTEKKANNMSESKIHFYILEINRYIFVPFHSSQVVPKGLKFPYGQVGQTLQCSSHRNRFFLNLLGLFIERMI